MFVIECVLQPGKCMVSLTDIGGKLVQSGEIYFVRFDVVDLAIAAFKKIADSDIAKTLSLRIV